MPIANLLPILFEGTPIRVAETSEGLPGVVMVDVADAIGHSRQGLRQMIQRNEDAWKGFMDNVTLSIGIRGKGNPNAIVLTKEGLIAVLVKITPSRIKNPEKRAKIIRFQRWAIETLTAVLDGRLTLVPTGKPLLKNVDAIRRMALRPRYEHGYAEEIKALAAAEGKGIGSIYRYMNLYRRAGELGLQRQPRRLPQRGYGPYLPEDYEKVREYFKEHPSDTAKAVRRNSGTNLKHWTVKRMLRNLRRGK